MLQNAPIPGGAWRHPLDGTVRSEVTNVAKIVPTNIPPSEARSCSKTLLNSMSLVLERDTVINSGRDPIGPLPGHPR